MKLLVTGGAGFIGSNFVLYMLQQHPDYEIVNVDALTYAGNLENLKAIENNPNYTFVKADITDVTAMDELISQGVDVVVNFAAESHVDRSILEPEVFVKTNVLGTQVLLDAAKNTVSLSLFKYLRMRYMDHWERQDYSPKKLLWLLTVHIQQVKQAETC